MDIEELIEAWRVNNKVNLELLELCTEDDFELKPGKGKTIRSNYVHIIGVRRSWVEATNKKLAVDIKKLDWKSASRKEMLDGLSKSCDAMATVFRNMAESKRQSRWTVPNFFAYCISHEANHRAQVELALRLNDREPDVAELYALWDWSKKG